MSCWLRGCELIPMTQMKWGLACGCAKSNGNVSAVPRAFSYGVEHFPNLYLPFFIS